MEFEPCQGQFTLKEEEELVSVASDRMLKLKHAELNLDAFWILHNEPKKTTKFFLSNCKAAENVRYFIDYKYDNAGLLCIEELACSLNVDISTTRDIKLKVVHAFSSSLNV